MRSRQVGGRVCAQHDAVEERQLERGLRETVSGRAGQHDLGATQAQVERIEQRHVAEQIALGRRQNALDQAVGLRAPDVVAREHSEPHQVLRRHSVRIGRGVVHGGMRPQQQIGGVIGGQVITAGVGVGVMGVEGALPAQRPFEIRPLAGRFVKCQRRPDHGGKIAGQAGKQQFAGAPGMPEPVALGHVCRDEIKSLPGHGLPFRLVQDDPGIDQGGDHQPVPIRQHLVVEPGPDPFLSYFQ